MERNGMKYTNPTPVLFAVALEEGGEWIKLHYTERRERALIKAMIRDAMKHPHDWPELALIRYGSNIFDLVLAREYPHINPKRKIP